MQHAFDAHSPSRRKHQRFLLNCHGFADFPTTTASLRIIDISLGGARIELPMHNAIYDLRHIRALRIDQVLNARVAWRWSNDRQAGVSFTAPALVRAGVMQLIEGAQEFREQT